MIDMALKRTQMGLLAAVLVALLARPCSAQSTSSCTAALMKLTPCLSYVSGNSSTPPSTCCSALSSVVQSQPQCLCLLLNGGVSSLGYNINQTLALSLPRACSVKTPSVSRCNALSPSSSPTTSPPADSSDNTPVTPTASLTPTISPGSKTTPAATSASGSIEASFRSLAFALLLASFGSILLKP